MTCQWAGKAYFHGKRIGGQDWAFPFLITAAKKPRDEIGDKSGACRARLKKDVRCSSRVVHVRSRGAKSLGSWL